MNGTEWVEKEVCISEVQALLENGYDVQVDSPDGYVQVNFFIDKGEWEEYVLELSNGIKVRCNENHLFETDNGWQYAKDLIENDKIIKYLTKHGKITGTVSRTGNIIPIVDINVNHENHRYYTNDVSSHNTGAGKSLFMCHMAAGNILAGKNVLYITLEMSEERIAERIDANLMNINIKELKNMSQEAYEKRIGRIKSKASGKLIIKEYPTTSASVNHFRHLLNELKLKKRFKPDIIYVDYINICASARVKMSANSNSYTVVKAIAEELRGLATEYNLPVMSATQVNRDGLGASDVDLTNTSESIGLPQTSDLMFALITTEELEDLGQVMIKQLKNRYNDPSYYRKFILGIDRAKMKLYDVEQTAQSDLINNETSYQQPNTAVMSADKKQKLKSMFN